MDLRKNVFNFLRGGSTLVPPTLLVIRVALLHTLYGVLNPFFPQLYIQNIDYNYTFTTTIASCWSLHLVLNLAKKRKSSRHYCVLFIKLNKNRRLQMGGYCICYVWASRTGASFIFKMRCLTVATI